MKTIQIGRDIYDYLLSKSEPGEAISVTLDRELKLAQPTESIDIDDGTYDYLLSKTAILGESASDILRRVLNLDGESGQDPIPAPVPEPTPGPVVVAFHIPPGTGPHSWNTQETEVTGTVGDTLRIFNDDAVPHRLHTPGTPFPHPANDIAPGRSADFVLLDRFDLGTPLYDHGFGSSAQFWIRVSPRE